MSWPSPRPELIVIGAGIVGLAHALAAARRGRSVVVIDRDARANGASVRNFGFVTVTGQERGRVWDLARRSAATWREIVGPAGIAIEQEGLLMVTRRREAAEVLDAFRATDMAADCEWLDADMLAREHPMIAPGCVGALRSHADLRVESRLAIPRLAAWLESAHGVAFVRGMAVTGVATGRVETSSGILEADAVVVCPGDDLTSLFPDRLSGVTRCKLHMMRLAAPGWRLPAPVMSDLGLIRYAGYAALPAAEALRRRLATERAEALANGIHLIVAQGADGTLIVGDSHHYADTPDPFAPTHVDALILREFAEVLGPPPPVIERWTGTYASADRHSLVDTPLPGVRLVVVTSGTGASTAFALAEDVIADLWGDA